ncbi:hypothetical protein KI387_022213 [Taxus chinensis]|uniref:Uncharacterized protein n=1 Tax=Taxus chinensis TaxID=29808 RepID=A0AA38G0H3_TAXCH|nr:hypothetical protein KI387_022213 [Taxus chinensis]
MQEGRPITFEIRQFKGKNMLKLVYEKEMMAILHAVNQWRPYLMSRHFKVKIDHDSLKYFLEQRLSSEEQQKWVTKKLGYDFEIIYKKGKENVVVDALSRRDTSTDALVCGMSMLTADWVDEARLEWDQDKDTKSLIHNIKKGSMTSNKFEWKGNALWYMDMLYLSKDFELKHRILVELHASLVGGHFGFLKTYHRIKREFFWEGLKGDVQNFVSECLVCQQNKGETIKTPDLLQPLPIPSQRWEEVSVDFITELPCSEGNNVIFRDCG